MWTRQVFFIRFVEHCAKECSVSRSKKRTMSYWFRGNANNGKQWQLSIWEHLSLAKPLIRRPKYTARSRRETKPRSPAELRTRSFIKPDPFFYVWVQKSTELLPVIIPVRGLLAQARTKPRRPPRSVYQVCIFPVCCFNVQSVYSGGCLAWQKAHCRRVLECSAAPLSSI